MSGIEKTDAQPEDFQDEVPIEDEEDDKPTKLVKGDLIGGLQDEPNYFAKKYNEKYNEEYRKAQGLEPSADKAKDEAEEEKVEAGMEEKKGQDQGSETKLENRVEGKAKEKEEKTAAKKEEVAKPVQTNILATRFSSRAGGIYIPPHKLRQMREQMLKEAQGDPKIMQRHKWELLRKSINEIINKVSKSK